MLNFPVAIMTRKIIRMILKSCNATREFLKTVENVAALSHQELNKQCINNSRKPHLMSDNHECMESTQFA